jgi:hypothetical protein
MLCSALVKERTPKHVAVLSAQKGLIASPGLGVQRSDMGINPPLVLGARSESILGLQSATHVGYGQRPQQGQVIEPSVAGSLLDLIQKVLHGNPRLSPRRYVPAPGGAR